MRLQCSACMGPLRGQLEARPSRHGLRAGLSSRAPCWPPRVAPCSNSLMHTRRVLLEAAADAASDQEARVEMEEAAAQAAEHARRHREAQRLFQRQAARAAEERKGLHSREQLRLEQLEAELQQQAAQVEQSAQVGRAGGGCMLWLCTGQNVGGSRRHA